MSQAPICTVYTISATNIWDIGYVHNDKNATTTLYFNHTALILLLEASSAQTHLKGTSLYS